MEYLIEEKANSSIEYFGGRTQIFHWIKNVREGGKGPMDSSVSAFTFQYISGTANVSSCDEGIFTDRR